MIRGTANTAVAAVIASAVDKYFSNGHYTRTPRSRVAANPACIRFLMKRGF
jgi:hypothetical protein